MLVCISVVKLVSSSVIVLIIFIRCRTFGVIRNRLWVWVIR